MSLENYFTWENFKGIKCVKHKYKLILRNNKLKQIIIFSNAR